MLLNTYFLSGFLLKSGTELDRWRVKGLKVGFFSLFPTSGFDSPSDSCGLFRFMASSDALKVLESVKDEKYSRFSL